MTDRSRPKRTRRSPSRSSGHQAPAEFNARALLEEIAADREAPMYARVAALKVLFTSTAAEDAKDARKKARAERNAEQITERALEILRSRR
jgi:hypothetical protein